MRAVDDGRPGVDLRQRRSRLAQAPAAGQRHAARVRAQHLRQALCSRGRRLGEQRLPALQAQQREHRQAAPVLAVDTLRLRGALGDAARCRQRGVAATLHQRREPREVLVVVSPVLADLEALRPLRLAQVNLNRQRRLVDARRVGVATDMDVGVCRHMHQVRRARCHRRLAAPTRRRQCPS